MKPFYRAFRAFSALFLRSFFRLEAPVDPHRALGLSGPVIYVGNHPNGLVDPGLVLILAQRQVTFLAKEPLFRMPVLGSILRAMGALPVYRKQDAGAAQGSPPAANEGTFEASVQALTAGGAITIFPEGKSHSEPQLAELKTGCARIAFDAVAKGAAVRVVPLGFTYSAKHRFRSQVHVEVGAPLEPITFQARAGEDGREAVRRATDALAEALRAVTLNLDAWEDLPVIEAAEALYALRRGEPGRDADRLKAFARGMALLRDEQPERFERLKRELLGHRARLGAVSATQQQLAYDYRPSKVAAFALRNLLGLGLGLPFFLLGSALFVIPYWFPPLAVRLARPEEDTVSSVKLLAMMLVAPLWWALLTGLCAWQLGPAWGLMALALVPPLAFFTRAYLERSGAAWKDARLFFVIGSREGLKQRLTLEGQGLSDEVEAVTQELSPRVLAQP